MAIHLGGPAVYFGSVVDKPTIGDAEQAITLRHILAVNRLMLVTAGLAVALGVLVRLYWS